MASQKITSSAKYYPVKISIEVSFTIHSHIIGRGGQNINTIMKQTSTKVHFPDENRIVGEKKSNTVTVAGDLANVETARQHIRMSIPVEYVVECVAEKLDIYGRSELVKEFTFLYGVLVRFSERNFGPFCQVTVRGNQQDILRLQEAVNHLGRIVTNGSNMPLITMKMEMTAENLKSVKDSLSLLEKKYAVTFLSPPLSQEQEEVIVWIRGTIAGVYKARTALTGLLPMNLMFHAPAVHLMFGVNERKLAKRLDVAVRMEASNKPNSFLLTITSYEKNAANMYEFRRQILHLPASIQSDDPSRFPHVLPGKSQAPPRFLRAADNIRKPVGQPSFRPYIEENSTPKPKKQLRPILNHLPENRPFPCNSLVIKDDDCSMPASLHALRFDPNSFRQLCQLFNDLGLSEYSDVMLMNEVDLAMFSTLNEGDLKMIGVPALHARKLMLQAINGLKNPASAGREEKVNCNKPFR